MGDIRAGQVDPASGGHINAAAGVVRGVGCDTTAGHLQRALYVNAAAVNVCVVAADRSAGNDAGTVLTEIDAATPLGISSCDHAAALAVTDGQGGAVHQFKHMAVSGLAGAIPVHSFTLQVDRDILIVDFDAVFFVRIDHIAGKFDDISVGRAVDLFLQLGPAVRRSVSLPVQISLFVSVDFDGIVSAIGGEVARPSLAFQPGGDVTGNIRHRHTDLSIGFESFLDSKKSSVTEVYVVAVAALGIPRDIQAFLNAERCSITENAAALIVSCVAGDHCVRDLCRAGIADIDPAAVSGRVAFDLAAGDIKCRVRIRIS